MSTPADAAVVAFPSEYERELAEVRARNAAALVRSGVFVPHCRDPTACTAAVSPFVASRCL